MSPETVEVYRSLTVSLLQTKFDNNQSALARALGVHATNMTRFLKHKKGGVSERTAKKLCELAGVPYPLKQHQPRAPRQQTATTEKVDPELERVLDFFDDRWPSEVQQLARMLVEHRRVRLDKTAWIEKLDSIESCIDDIVKDITK